MPFWLTSTPLLNLVPPFARGTGWSEDELVIRGKRDPVTKSSEATAMGSSETFEEFYEREFRWVVGLAYALSGSRSGAA